MDNMVIGAILVALVMSTVNNVTAQEIMIMNHYNESDPSNDVDVRYKQDNGLSRPEGFNDKYHGSGWDNSTSNSGDRPNHYWLVPPFIIGASVAAVLYIICNCFYLHCYAHRKIKHLAERHFSQPMFLADEASSGGYQAFTPVAYDEGDDTGRFLFYQPINENEWEVSVDESSSRSSVRSKSSMRKKSLVKKIFGKKKANSSTSSAPEEMQGDKRAICLVPFNRSLSAPAKVPASTARVVYAPVLIPKMQSMKNTRGSVKNTSSDGNILPQTPLLILGKGEAKGKVVFRETAPQQPEPTSIAAAGEEAEETAGKADETLVTFHLPEGGDEDPKSPPDTSSKDNEGRV